MENEINRIWKPIKGFEDIYELRDDGLLHCLPKPHRRIEYTYGSLDSDGYLRLSLTKNGKEKTKRVNILVYETFVGEIPKGYDVHHINGNTKDNRVENLELIEKHIHSRMHGEKKTKPIIQYTKNGDFVAEYESLSEATMKTEINQGSISNCCLGRYKTAGGYVWKFKEVA